MWDVTFSCDICGKRKTEANHWWMATVDGSREQRFGLMRWSQAESQSPEMYHLCGQGCAMQALERYMNEGSLGKD